MTEVQKDDKTKRREAYSAATTRLRNQHRPYFNSLFKEETEKRGLAWTARLTDAEKAEKQARELIAAHPELATIFAPPDAKDGGALDDERIHSTDV